MKVTNLSLKMGQKFKIRVKTSDDSSSFAINIGHDSDNIALHFNPRFDYGGDSNVIVCNHCSGGNWGDEERESNFPFSRGDESKFYINFTDDQFYIQLPDGNTMSFPNKLGDVKYDHFDVTGDAKLCGFKISD